ncbi:hypothetical protein BDV29DRAFT_180243 [Aspergillus leporis]|uniref:Uncharacterized protein n=1 Tax=Aspergillus leporis TaxID=41062 RepID=A0A5N5WQP5_9EURO|nr:hypothetical protein BDV29DRAFT_180243 [Aspergillus leporis]
MQITSLLAAAIALSTSGVLGEKVKIAFTSSGKHENREIDAEKLQKLEHPDYLTDIQNTDNCVLWRKVDKHGLCFRFAL